MTDRLTNEQLHASSFLQGHNAEYVEKLYAQYVKNPSSVDSSWQDFFSELADDISDVVAEASGPSWSRPDWPPVPNDDLTSALDGQWAEDPNIAGEKIQQNALENGKSFSNSDIQQAVLDSMRALMIIRAYRIRGHLIANLDPLSLRTKDPHPELDPRFYGFNEIDMDRPIYLDNVLGLKTATMRQIVDKLLATYCGTFALQYMHLSNPDEATWLKERIESWDRERFFTKEGRKAILNKMVEAEGFEKFCHVKYSGTKRFGLDGAESLIPAMEQIIKKGGALGIKDIIVGMPHRGRLNVLVNVMSKPYRAIFNEFLGGSMAKVPKDGVQQKAINSPLKVG